MEKTLISMKIDIGCVFVFLPHQRTCGPPLEPELVLLSYEPLPEPTILQSDADVCCVLSGSIVHTESEINVFCGCDSVHGRIPGSGEGDVYLRATRLSTQLFNLETFGNRNKGDNPLFSI